MKVRSEREKTKVVIRHLPPSLTQSDLFQHIDSHFASRYNWFSFRPGNNSHKRQRHSRAYIDFKCPDDVFEFAEFFDGHVFVNERGAQHKVIVEYAPSQRVPKPSAKKDGREGTIFKDPDYLEFLKLIAKPQEHLPSAEIQLERKESEQVGASKETPIVTPLMEYIRQKRAVDSGMQLIVRNIGAIVPERHTWHPIAPPSIIISHLAVVAGTVLFTAKMVARVGKSCCTAVLQLPLTVCSHGCAHSYPRVVFVCASSAVAKVCRRSRAALPGKPGSGNIKRGSEKKKYVQKDNAKSATRKESKNKSAFIVVPRRDDQFAESSIKGISDIKTYSVLKLVPIWFCIAQYFTHSYIEGSGFPAVILSKLHGVEGSISGIPLTSESGKKKFLLLKGKQQDIPSVGFVLPMKATEATVKQQNVQSGNSPISTPAKQNQRREASGRLIRSILLNNEARQSQSTTGTQHKIQILSSENGQRPSRRFGSRSGLNNQVSNHDAAQINSEGDSRRALDEKFIKRDLHGLGSSAKTEKRTRNKDRPDRGVWTPLRRSDVSHAGNDYSSSSLAQPTQSNPESAEGESSGDFLVSTGEVKENVPSGNRGGEFSASAGGHGGNPSIENGSQRNFIHHGASYVVKDDGAVSSISKGKPSKKSVGHSAHEVYISKSGSINLLQGHKISASGHHSCYGLRIGRNPQLIQVNLSLSDLKDLVDMIITENRLALLTMLMDLDPLRMLERVKNLVLFSGQSRESRIPMQPRQSRRNYVEGSDLAESESNSKHFLKIILPSPIHANQMRIPEEFIKRFGDELSNVATVTVPDGRVWKMRLKKCGKDVSFRSKWREFVEYYSLGYGSYLVFRYEGNSKFRVLIFDTTSAEICYPDLDNRKRSKVDDQTRKKEHKEAIDEDDVNLKAWKKESDCSEIAKDASTKPKHPSVTCTIQPYRLYVRSHFSKKHLKPNVCMMLQNCNGEQWDVSCVCHNTRYGGMMLTRGWRKFVRDNDLSEGDPCVLELIETNPAVVLKLTVLGAPEYHSSRPH
ncbi:Regulator of nonsense transcripts UPF3 isoform A [Glycine soja]|uniref:Regulator of nonsense transcripts UPF3 isoform A n=2 Tax=Glycine subgen. Soja TaxID=1462606 RepID=A0A445L5L6_GLYSO|nr:Regulator of nonsense transcripts UPF3 isoform A [Glycine soja]